MLDLWDIFEQEKQRGQVPPLPKPGLWDIFNAEMQLPPTQILKPPEETLIKEVAPPGIQKRMAEPTREAYRPKTERALRHVTKPTLDILRGGTEAVAALGTGIPSFLAGATTQTAETLFNVLKDAYDSWKVGFKNVETFAPKPVARYLLKTAGESTSVSDWIHKQAEPWQPKTEMGKFMTGTSIAPVVAYMKGVEEVAKITSDDPSIQKGVTYLGDMALIFAVPKAKAYIKNQIRTKAPVITSKLKGMIIESDKMPAEMKRKITEVPDTMPEELEALPPGYEKGERIGIPREEVVKPEALEIKKAPIEKELAKLSDKPGKSLLFEAIRTEGGIDGRALKRAKGSGPYSWDELTKRQRVPMNVFQDPKTKGTGKLSLDEMAERIAKSRPELMKGEGDEALAQSMIDEMTRKPDWSRSERQKAMDESEHWEYEEADLQEHIKGAINDIAKRSEGGKVNVGVVDDVRKEKLPWLSNEDIAERLEYEGVRIAKGPEGAVRAGSLAYGMKLPKYAKGINLERISADYGVKKFIRDIADVYDKEITAKRRGKVTWEESQALADSLGLPIEELQTKIKSKTGKLEAYVQASRDTLNTSALKTLELSREYAKNPTDESLATFTHAFTRHSYIQTEVSAAATEIGRALSIHRKLSNAKEGLLSANYKAVIRALGKKNITEEIARKMALLDMNDPAAVSKFIRESMKATTHDKIFEVWINSLLSGIPTQVVNVVSNTMNLLTKPVEKAVAATIEAPKRLVGKRPEAYFGEASYEAIGMFAGLPEGFRKMAYAWSHEMAESGISKIEVRRPRAIKGLKGTAIRLPGRALIAADEFFKGVLYTSDIYGMAYRRAVGEGLKGRALSERAADLIRNPDDAMMSHATGEMLYKTFQKELGRSGKAAQRFREEALGGFVKWIVPFMRVSINIPKYGFERTPFNFPRVMYKAIKGQYKGAEFAENMAKPLIGTLGSVAVFIECMKGNVTGSGPTDRNERQKLYDQGWLPYSFKIGDKYYSYARIEPLATMFGVTADMTEIWKDVKEGEREDLAAKMMFAFSENVTNKTFMRGVSDVLNAISDPERHGGRWFQTFLSTGVPTGVAYTARATDPYFRDVRTLLDKIKSRIPGLAETLPPRVGISGEPAERGGLFAGGIPSFIERMVSPVWISEEKTNDVHRELNRLDYSPGMPLRKVRDVELSPEEYSEFSEMTGKVTFKMWDLRIGSKDYMKLSDDEKLSRLKKDLLDAREASRILFIFEHPEMIDKMLELRKE